jgi:hypothetical protein
LEKFRFAHIPLVFLGRLFIIAWADNIFVIGNVQTFEYVLGSITKRAKMLAPNLSFHKNVL